jgi:acyl-coenzyme A synthetase/AMP-(fatty) acid ligase
MEQIDFLISRFKKNLNAGAIVCQDEVMTNRELCDSVINNCNWLKKNGVIPGSVVILKGDYSALAISMLLALIEQKCIIIPLTLATFDNVSGQLDDVAPEYIIDVFGVSPIIESWIPLDAPALYGILRERNVPGLVLFTSGSSGKPKAVVHDFSKLLEKFYTIRPGLITLNFLLFDHWGGLNTLLHGLSNSCLIIIPEKRTPEYICKLIQDYRVELLPTTPSFINTLLISKAYKSYDLSSLKLITYGAEPMSQMALTSLRVNFPKVDLRQTYGMIELGVLRVKSKSADSLWVKLGGEGYAIRVVDDILQIRADAAMLGYINADSPFTEDGYLITGDLVETDGDWVRILGRKSDIINVGGQKVYPAEVEAVLLDCPQVGDAIVYGETNPLLGNIVCANIVLIEGASDKEARSQIRKFCNQILQPFMVPTKFLFVDEIAQSSRLKRVRTNH